MGSSAISPSWASALGDSPFAIRAATANDLPAILRLIRALAQYERLEHLCVATEADIARGLFGEPQRAEVLLASHADEVIAFALFFHNFSTFLGRPGIWLEDLFVLPEHRRRGCGKALLRRLAALARERDCGRFEWAVLDWNADAIGFYESLGAAILPDWRIVRVTGPALHVLANLPDGAAPAPPDRG